MDTLRSVLQEIQAGRTSFTPVSNTDQDMWDFQPIAKILVHADRQGFLESCSPHKESEGPHDWYDLVMVRGGLSYKGEMFLTAPAGGDAERQLADIVQLKPSFYGIGIDLNALWKRWKDRKGK